MVTERNVVPKPSVLLQKTSVEKLTLVCLGFCAVSTVF